MIGKVITFYSYKGGVGRTMSLMNVACIMAENKKRVLTIDWDLEAPGLHSFFNLNTEDLSKPGLVDLIIEFIEFIKIDNNNDEDKFMQFLDKNINRFIIKGAPVGSKGLSIDLIKSGRFDKDYVAKLNSINWIELYKEAPTFFRTLAMFLESKYDYTLIDSRTGLSDTSGVCNMLMPSVLVLVFVLNNQNLDGIIDIAKQSVNYRLDSNDYRDLTVLPLPSRIDNENPNVLADWIKKYTLKFEKLFQELYLLDNCELVNYFNKAKIPYKPIYAYGENIPVLIEKGDNDFFISYHYKQFYELIQDNIESWEVLSAKEYRVNEEKARSHLERGIHFISKNEFANAIIELKKAEQLFPKNAEVYFYYGKALYELAKQKKDISFYEDSYYMYELSAALAPNNYLTFFNWGNVIFNQAILDNNEVLYKESYDKYNTSLKLNSSHDLEFYEPNVPKEVMSQGAVAIATYLTMLNKTSETFLNEARIIVLGDKGSGKTSMVRKLIDFNAGMTNPEESTADVDTSTWKLAKENINVQIWDFAGHTVTHAIHQFFLSERCLYLLVYNGRTEDTSSLEYWLDHMKNYGGNSEAIILVNERDTHHYEIPINRLKEQYAIAGVYYLNIEKDKQKFKKFRNDLSDYIANNPSWKYQEIPKSYYQVKEELEQLFTKNKVGEARELITRETFDTIAQKYGIEDSERLLKDLHALGISFWYKGMEQYNTLILNPEWISDGVYQIINWVHNQKTHEIALSDFKKVFAKDKERYPKDQYHFLFDLILNYELAYKIGKGNKLIIPHLLKEDQPANLPTFEIGDSLMLKYKADHALPPHTISRFIVKHSDQIRKQGNTYFVWRYGVILEDGKGNTALVREWDRAIDVSVKGPSKTEYISQLRATLNAIFDGYKSEKPELQYNINPFGDESYLIEYTQISEHIGKPQENWLAEKLILSYKDRGLNHYDPISNQNISIKAILDEYSIPYNQKINFINNPQTVNTGDHSNIQANTLNFKECNISLQGSLNELAFELSENGEAEAAKELENAAKALEKVENETNPDQVKKKGVWNRLKRTIANLNDEKSTLHQAVKLLKNGKALVKGIMDTYEKVSPWIEQMTQS